MECSEVRVILLENTDTEIPSEFREDVDTHLAVCRTCATFVSSPAGAIERAGESAKAGGARGLSRKSPKPCRKTLDYLDIQAAAPVAFVIMEEFF